MSDLICKGSFVLGSACGRCERCAAERQKVAEQLQDYRKAYVLILQQFGDEDLVKGGVAQAVNRLLAGHQKMNNELSAQEEHDETLDGRRFPRFRRDVDGERRPYTSMFTS